MAAMLANASPPLTPTSSGFAHRRVPSAPSSPVQKPAVPPRPKARLLHQRSYSDPALRLPVLVPPPNVGFVEALTQEAAAIPLPPEDQAPDRPPPPPPHIAFEEPADMATLRRDKARPGVPLQRVQTETPVPSTMSGLLQETYHIAEHPVSGLPPSPPLTRRSTTTTVRSSKGRDTRLSGPAGDLIPLTREAASGVSLKELQKVGKALGQTSIDYLLPHGSLSAPVSAYFHPTHDPRSLDVPPSMAPNATSSNPVEGIFGNLNFLLDSYLTVLSAGGSIAVSTGYRSVARRLLERVEGMFARDLGVEGAGWAEVLEYTRGGRPLPALCVLPVRGLLIAHSAVNGGIDDDGATTADLAESVVAGVAKMPAMGKVEEWLEEVERVLTAENAPADAAQTRADEVAEDKIVTSIIEGILFSNAAAESVTVFRTYLATPPLLAETRLALTRLYPAHPPAAITPPIVALYLLLHSDLHPVLRAVAAVAEPELDLIHSGRFDAFLDGRDNVVARDEAEELAAIASLDKRLWSVLEGLEDEIEELHTRALVVRRALKARKECIAARKPTAAAAALSPASSSRPASPDKLAPSQRGAQHHHHHHQDQQQQQQPADDRAWEDNWDSLRAPITPDDSASNITTNRRRRMQRAYESAAAISRSGSRRDKNKNSKDNDKTDKADKDDKEEKEKEKEKDRKHPHRHASSSSRRVSRMEVAPEEGVAGDDNGSTASKRSSGGGHRREKKHRDRDRDSSQPHDKNRRKSDRTDRTDEEPSLHRNGSRRRSDKEKSDKEKGEKEKEKGDKEKEKEKGEKGDDKEKEKSHS